MNRHLHLLILIFLATGVTAQQSDSLNITNSAYLKPEPTDTTYRNQLKYTLLRTIDPYNPGIELSYERLLSKNISLQFAYTYMTDVFRMEFRDIEKEYKGYRFSLEAKYFIEPEKDFRPYVAVEVAYMQNSYTQYMSFIPKDSTNFEWNPTYAYGDTVNIRKQTITGNLKFGAQIPVKHVIIDISAGIGIKYIDTRHSERLNPEDRAYWGRHPNINAPAHREGIRYVLNLPFNIRIGCTF